MCVCVCVYMDKFIYIVKALSPPARVIISFIACVHVYIYLYNIYIHSTYEFTRAYIYIYVVYI